MSMKKHNAIALYMEGIRDGRPQEALDKYIGARYTQHSTGVADGKEGFLNFFLPFLERTPERDIRVVCALEDGPHVFCHVFQSLNGGDAKWVTMDLFDTDSDDRIIEHWDVIAPYEEATVSGEDMVGSNIEPSNHHLTAESKALVKEYVKVVLTGGNLDRLNAFVCPDLVQHAPQIGNGLQGLQEALQSGQHPRTQMLFKLVGEGDLVATLSKYDVGDLGTVAFDLYRVSGGKIVEHWAVSEPILPRDQWGNSGKF